MEHDTKPKTKKAPAKPKEERLSNTKNEAPLSEIPLEHAASSKKVGHLLKGERLKKEMSLEDVMKCLHIPREYLEAIENSVYDKLPEMAYTLGFIRAYSRLLDMDSETMIKGFQEEYAPPKEENESFLSTVNAINQKPSKKVLWIAAGGVLFIFLLIFLIRSFNRPSLPSAPITVTSAIADAEGTREASQ